MNNSIFSKNNYKNVHQGLYVIGIGLPRTGTTTLQAALEILGFNNCHHMCQLYTDPDRTQQFIRALDGEQIDFYKLMQGYTSASGPPISEFYKEICQVYPNVKIILTMRDNDQKWFNSIQDTINSNRRGLFYTLCTYPIRSLRLQNILAKKIVNNLKEKYGEFSPTIHSQYNTKVIHENQNRSLLIFNPREEWAPLCKFLGVDIPEKRTFPHLNESELYNKRTRQSIIRGLTAWLFIFASISFVFWFCWYSFSF